MRILIRYKFLLIILVAVMAFACGDGGGGGGTVAGGGGGAGGTGITKPITSKGTITGFGSVFVNGVEFETTDSAVTVDDNPGTDDDLGLGMVVTVTGTINEDGTSGTAESIEFEDNLEGPISSIDTTTNTLVVLGQTVVWDNSTICENSSSASIDCATLAVDNLVEVSGFPTTSGSVLATRIEIKNSDFDPAENEVELKGTISSLDTAAKTFLIGSQVVDYSDPNLVLEDILASGLADGMFVEVEGNLNADVLEATKIELEEEDLEEEMDVAEDEEVEIEGLVDTFASCTGSDCTFTVNGQPIQTSSATEFKNGSSSDIGVGIRLEVEGTIDANGVLIASEVEFHDERIEIEAEVQAIGADSVTLLGITVIATSLTEFDDNSNSNTEPFGLGDIQEGDFLRIRGHLDNGSIIADRIERRDPEDQVLLQGPVDFATNPNLVVVGVTVQTNDNTQFEGEDESPKTLDEFFALVQPGTIVKAKGTFDGSVIVADEVAIEDNVEETE